MEDDPMALKVNESPVSIQGKKIALLLTVYERLYSRYFMRARILDCSLLVASITVCLTTFVDPKILGLIGVSSDKSFIILGFGAFATFAFSLISLVSNWKNQAAAFGQAADTLNRLKAECGAKVKAENPEDLKNFQYKAIEYSAIINHLPKIPEKEFHKLKTLHKRRMELGRMIEMYPGSSTWLLKFMVHLRANLNVLLRRPVVDDSVEEVG